MVPAYKVVERYIQARQEQMYFKVKNWKGQGYFRVDLFDPAVSDRTHYSVKGAVGHVIMGMTHEDEMEHDPKCQENVIALKAKIRKPKVQVWFVSSSEIDPEYRGLGVGGLLYSRAFKEISPAIITPGRCNAIGGTSPSAEKVWSAMASRYPHVGSGNTMAIYVR